LSKIVAEPQKIKILLGVSGGIAAYKSAELIRRLKEQSFDVRVVMTDSAKNFITPMTLQAVSGNPVHEQLFDCQAEAAMGHIELAKWADVILIAPATANIIAKIAGGLADDLLTTLILASPSALVIAPAMNQQMWANQATLANVQLLKKRGIEILGPAEGEQACGDVGFGRMLEPMDIIQGLRKSLGVDKTSINPAQTFTGKKLVITAGPTIEAIDPVRFISNHSSGKMGYALAEAAILAGAQVTLISGPVNLKTPNKVTRISVTSAQEMLLAVKEQIDACDIFIGCAAVADYAPVEVAAEKIKKNAAEMQFKLKKNPDIISWVTEQKKPPFVVGFAAESQNLQAFAESKLKKKKLDMICANDISQQGLGFNSNNNEILLLNRDGGQQKLPPSSKRNIAVQIIAEISKKIT